MRAAVFAIVLLLVDPLDAALHHQLKVRLDPGAHRIEVRDTLSSSDGGRDLVANGLRFVLHAGLAPRVVTKRWRLEPNDETLAIGGIGLDAIASNNDHAVKLKTWRLVAEVGAELPVSVIYDGVIHHPLTTLGEEYQRSFSETPGIIDERGVVLSGSTFWVPTSSDDLITFEVEVIGLDPTWDVVSQGQRTAHRLEADDTRTTTWTMAHPTEEVHLVAGPWHEYGIRAGEVHVMAFLRSEDPGLAGRYLEATKRYLDLYESMLPAYPYASFALVENFWETGYGMPGFTLLGPQVIRFPWILTSSYPHELLHNWWGNSVYVDFERGNWCEGLTAYMADHLFAEQRGEGARYRRDALKKFTDMVSEDADFPLSDFRSRHSASSEAVGYGKSLMLFHMVRRAVGDETFLEAVRLFTEKNQFRRTSFSDLANAFSIVTGDDWTRYFETWTTRTGAPELVYRGATVDRDFGTAAGWTVEVELEQVQTEDPFPITVPLAVTVDGRSDPIWTNFECHSRECEATVVCPTQPIELRVDPGFDVMRRLDPLEVAPSLSTLFGATDPVFVLPSDATDEERAAWESLAIAWARPDEPRTVLDNDLEGIPEGPVWILGRDNLHAEQVMKAVEPYGARFSPMMATLGETSLPRHAHSLVAVARAKSDPSTAIAWVAAHTIDAIPGLTRKLPHYTRYSYLAFRGPEPENVLKGTFEPVESPMIRPISRNPDAVFRLPERAPLAKLPPVFDMEALAATVNHLASDDMAGRGLGTPGLERATTWVESQMTTIGLRPAGDTGTFRQSWNTTIDEPQRDVRLTNLVGLIPGSDPSLENSPMLLMAHLDHLGHGWPDVRAGNEGRLHPGADDNASGVATLLAVAGSLNAAAPHLRPVLVAVVTGEEAGLLGSRHLIESFDEGTTPFACLNLDTVGRLGDGKILVLDAASAREWRFIFMGVGHTTGAPIEVVGERLDSSDQGACIEHGIPGVQIFTGAHADYHRPSDTIDHIDGKGMVVVAEVALEASTYLTQRVEPLTVQIKDAQSTPNPGATRSHGRRAALGTVPDFSFAGPGVRVKEVLEGSAAEKAGIQAGDVIRTLDGEKVHDLRGYAALLSTRAPGDEVSLTLERDGRLIDVAAELTAR